MPFNLLLLPLVGGYFVIAHSEWYKYTSQRLQSERLLFNSVIAGVVLISISYSIKTTMLLGAPEFVHRLRSLIPVNAPYTGVAACSLIIGIFGTLLTNFVIDETSQIEKAIDKIGNHLEKLLKESLHGRKLVQITLTNEKVYVGWCLKIPVPDRTSYITIVPVLSGYRDPTTKVLQFTTDYFTVYSQYVKEGKATSIKDLDVSLVIKSDSIISASRFDLEMYERFNAS